MRRADIARCSAVTGGADYISTLPDQRRGVGVLWRQSLRGHMRSACSKHGQHFRQTSHGITQLTASLGRTGVGSTVISRFMTGISAGPPQMLLRCQTLPSMWTLGKDKPVIPGVRFI